MSEEHQQDDGEEPHRSLMATMPAGTITRVLILLALLAGVMVLQRKAGSIAGCMNQSFMLPQPAGAGTPASGHIRARVALPETPAR